MHSKWTGWLFLVWGILLLLPMIGVTQLNSLSSWLIPIIVIVIGAIKLMKMHGK